MLKGPEIHSERVPVQPEDVVWVNRTNSLLNAVVERGEANVLWESLSALGTLEILVRLTRVGWLI